MGSLIPQCPSAEAATASQDPGAATMPYGTLEPPREQAAPMRRSLPPCQCCSGSPSHWQKTGRHRAAPEGGRRAGQEWDQQRRPPLPNPIPRLRSLTWGFSNPHQRRLKKHHWAGWGFIWVMGRISPISKVTFAAYPIPAQDAAVAIQCYHSCAGKDWATS